MKIYNKKQMMVETEDITVKMKISQLREILKECAVVAVDEYIQKEKSFAKQRLVKAVDAARILGCNPSTVNRWKHSGLLTPIPIGGRDYYSMDEINSMLSTR